MIQRKQTVWLILAALAAAGVLYFDVYRATIIDSLGVAQTLHLEVAAHYPSLIVAVLMIIMPLIAIFMFKNRKQQRGVVLGGLFATFGFIAVNQMNISNKMSAIPTPTDGTYFVGSVMPIVVLVFLVLAIRGINKDEKLVKSLDRLR